MKYKLKKDLPFAKAGEEVEISIANCFGNVHFNPNQNSIELSQNNLDKLVSEGWIEEVKPREGYVHTEDIIDKEALNEYEADDYKKGFIKVREVIE